MIVWSICVMNSYGKKRNSYVIGKECRGLRTGISRKKRSFDLRRKDWMYTGFHRRTACGMWDTGCRRKNSYTRIFRSACTYYRGRRRGKFSYADTGITDVGAGRERYHNSGGTSGYGWYHQECGQSLCEDPGTLWGGRECLYAHRCLRISQPDYHRWNRQGHRIREWDFGCEAGDIWSPGT